MIVGIPDDPWRRIVRSVKWTERHETTPAGAGPRGAAGAPVFVRPTSSLGSSSDAYNATFQRWQNGAPAGWEDADEPNACYARDVNGGELLTDGTVYFGAVAYQYDADGSVLVQVVAVAPSGSGAGSGASGSSCTLETVRFDVVTDVTCDPVLGLVVTRERISITGCNLSISGGAVPSGAGTGGVVQPELDDPGQPLAGHPDLAVTIPDGPYAGTYTATWHAGTGQWQFTPNGIVFFLFEADRAACPATGFYLSNGSACAAAVTTAPFAATFAGGPFGATGSVTVALA